jgi:hypothetical protein
MNCVDCLHLKQWLGYVKYCKQGRLLDGYGRIKVWKDGNSAEARKPNEWKQAARCDLFDYMGDPKQIEQERLKIMRGKS